MNTGFVRPAVATVPTVYGIETFIEFFAILNIFSLQQYLPFTVLKLCLMRRLQVLVVATVPTVYGIETMSDEKITSTGSCNSTYRLRY